MGDFGVTCYTGLPTTIIQTPISLGKLLFITSVHTMKNLWQGELKLFWRLVLEQQCTNTWHVGLLCLTSVCALLSCETVGCISDKLQPFLFVWQWRSPYPEKLLGGPRVQGSICYLCLFSQVFCTLDGRNHPLHGQEGSQVGSVWRDNDQCEKPPHTPDYTTWQRPTDINRVIHTKLCCYINLMFDVRKQERKMINSWASWADVEYKV